MIFNHCASIQAKAQINRDRAERPEQDRQELTSDPRDKLS